MIDYLGAIRRESHDFAAAARSVSFEDSVPSCPDWNVADLIWHLTEVQHFWACIVENLLPEPDAVPPFERPDDEALLGAYDTQSNRLVTALTNRNPEDPCWSWHDEGRSVGWVQRRQAHEALIHRVDAELASGAPSAIAPDLAIDGVDEVLRLFLDLDNLPEWATFEEDGTSARVEIDTGRAYTMAFGRFLGDSPVSGNSYDFTAMQLNQGLVTVDATIRGRADDLDLWLWGRGPLSALAIEGDVTVAAKLRDAAVEATQ